MSTVTEIEHAIERLPEPDVARLVLWLADYRRQRQLPPADTHHELDSLIGTWREDPAFDAAIRAFEQVDEPACK